MFLHNYGMKTNAIAAVHDCNAATAGGASLLRGVLLSISQAVVCQAAVLSLTALVMF